MHLREAPLMMSVRRSNYYSISLVLNVSLYLFLSGSGFVTRFRLVFIHDHKFEPLIHLIYLINIQHKSPEVNPAAEVWFWDVCGSGECPV